MLFRFLTIGMVVAWYMSVASSVTAQAPPPPEPSWCNGLDCPVYKSVRFCNNSQGSFEIRSYDALRWVSTNVSSVTYDGVGQTGFNKLFKYISGANVGQQKVDMTAPVATDIYAGQGPNCNSTFRISFFIPYLYQGAQAPPQPTEEDVYIYTRPATLYAVGVFSGWANWWEVEVQPQIVKLGAAVALANLTVPNGQESVSQYDSPFTIFNRHNEIWMPIVGPLPLSC